jgi:hypothetical protein
MLTDLPGLVVVLVALNPALVEHAGPLEHLYAAPSCLVCTIGGYVGAIDNHLW